MLKKLMEGHPGKTLGFFAGLVLGLVYLISGLLDTLIFLIIVSAGVYFGGKMDRKEDLTEILDRILPGKFTKH